MTDENRNVLFNYCEASLQRIPLMNVKFGRNVYVQYQNGSNGVFAVGFSWYVMPGNNAAVMTTAKPTVPPFNSLQCGNPATQPSRNQVRIVGGTTAIPNSHPW